MKSIYSVFLIIPFIFCFFISAAQMKPGNPFISVGPEFSLESERAYKYGAGGSLTFGVPISPRSAFTLSSGYTYWRGKMQKTSAGTDGRNLHMSIIPVRLGFRYFFYNGLYVEPQIGYSKVQFEKKYWPGFEAYSYGINLGILKNRHLDVSLQYQGFKTNDNSFTLYRFSSLSYGQYLHSAGVRVAYNFSLKK